MEAISPKNNLITGLDIGVTSISDGQNEIKIMNDDPGLIKDITIKQFVYFPSFKKDLSVLVSLLEADEGLSEKLIATYQINKIFCTLLGGLPKFITFSPKTEVSFQNFINDLIEADDSIPSNMITKLRNGLSILNISLNQTPNFDEQTETKHSTPSNLQVHGILTSKRNVDPVRFYYKVIERVFKDLRKNDDQSDYITAHDAKDQIADQLIHCARHVPNALPDLIYNILKMDFTFGKPSELETIKLFHSHEKTLLEQLDNAYKEAHKKLYPNTYARKS